MTAVGWDETGWDEEDEPAAAPTVPPYYCEDPCCQPPRRPGLLARLLAALRPTPKGDRR